MDLTRFNDSDAMVVSGHLHKAKVEVEQGMIARHLPAAKLPRCGDRSRWPPFNRRQHGRGDRRMDPGIHAPLATEKALSSR